MTTLTVLDYTAEVLHLCYILLTALFRFTVKAAVVVYVIGQYASEYYHQLSHWLSPLIRRANTTTLTHNFSL